MPEGRIRVAVTQETGRACLVILGADADRLPAYRGEVRMSALRTPDGISLSLDGSPDLLCDKTAEYALRAARVIRILAVLAGTVTPYPARVTITWPPLNDKG